MNIINQKRKKLIVVTICGFMASMLYAQTSNPKGLYKLTEIIRQDGERVELEYLQYKYCAERVTLQLGYTPDFFKNRPFSFSLENVDGKPLLVTGELSKTENRGIQVFGEDVENSFTLRWFNDRSPFNEHAFPFNTNTDEVYRIMKDSTDAVFQAICALEMQPGTQQNPLKGAWRLRGKQKYGNARSQYWIEGAEEDLYLAFGDNCMVYVNGNDKFPKAPVRCYALPVKYLSDNAFELFDHTSTVHWFDAETIAITSQDDNGQVMVNIWDRCGLPQNIQDVFGTDIPQMNKDVSRYSVDYFQKKYGQPSDEIRMGYETYNFAVEANEKNNAIYPVLMRHGLRDEYEAMRDSLLARMMRGEINADEAVSRYVFWFYNQFDHHTNCNGKVFHQLCKETEIDYHKLIKNYAPKPLACKVDAETYLVRLPSCHGMFPTMEWVNEKVEEYLHSGCKYLILDLRGNNGGSDAISLAFASLMGDCNGMIDENVYYRASFLNKKKLKDDYLPLSPEWIGHILHRANQVEEGEYSIWNSRQKGSSDFQPKVRKGAIIIDSECASAGESPVNFVRIYSKSHAKVYGREPSEGSDQTGNIIMIELPNSSISMMIPMTVDGTFDQVTKTRKPGQSPDVIIPLPYPEELTDNIDPWVLWVAKKMKK